MKIQDVRLRGRGFTLFVACDEVNVSPELMDNILWAIHLKAGSVNNDGFSLEKEYEIIKQNPDMEVKFTEEELMRVNGIDIPKLISEGFMKKSEDKYPYELTQKALDILQRAAEIQVELDNSDFNFCPCQML